MNRLKDSQQKISETYCNFHVPPPHPPQKNMVSRLTSLFSHQGQGSLHKAGGSAKSCWAKVSLNKVCMPRTGSHTDIAPKVSPWYPRCTVAIRVLEVLPCLGKSSRGKKTPRGDDEFGKNGLKYIEFSILMVWLEGMQQCGAPIVKVWPPGCCQVALPNTVMTSW